MWWMNKNCFWKKQNKALLIIFFLQVNMIAKVVLSKKLYYDKKMIILEKIIRVISFISCYMLLYLATR